MCARRIVCSQMLIRAYCTGLLEYCDVPFARASCLLVDVWGWICCMQECSWSLIYRVVARFVCGTSHDWLWKCAKGEGRPSNASLMPTMHPLKPGNVSSKEFSPQPIKRNESLVSGSSLLGKVDRLPQQKGNPSRVVKDWNLA